MERGAVVATRCPGPARPAARCRAGRTSTSWAPSSSRSRSFLLKAYSPAKGSRLERSGSVIIDVAVSSLLALNCFVVLPSLALCVGEDVGAMAAHLTI
ncbi:hypothetical protein C2845_PM03G14650 [Panicum miliaceum]|uniref:Uncharacterized protein n=1 Tax=Panicum miliaceum TaxID=4540 RepID=A0A3L6TD31_PANMI|nr:hypothetical protein C2845_PM03G14650 [Panicum miliaceum]